MLNKSVSATYNKTANRCKERGSTSPESLSKRPIAAIGMDSAVEGRSWENASRISYYDDALPSRTNTSNLNEDHPPPARVKHGLIRPLGFQKTYNSILFFVFAGATLAFTLARFSYVNVTGDAPSSFKNGALPGEWYSYHEGRWLTGITIHLRAALPCGFLMIWQFVPRLRRQLPQFHRINGYTVIILTIISNIGALMICRRSLGGGLDVQSAVVALTVASTAAIAIAYYNIKRLRVDRHRAWMLRTVFYLGSIISTRPIMIISAVVISKAGGYYQVQSCEKIAFINGGGVDAIAGRYPACAGLGAGQEGSVAVPANLKSGLREQLAAAMGLSFGMALWVSLFLHAVGVEIYLACTSEEGDRAEYQLRGEIENWT
jgi:hypothetical protein